MLHDRQTLLTCGFGVVVHCHIFSRPQGKRTTRDYREGEGDPSVQLYSGSVLIDPIGGTFARRSSDAQY